MRRAARWQLVVAVSVLAAIAHAQTAPQPPAAPTVAPRPDSVQKQAPTFVADTTRRVVVVDTTEPTDAVTRRTGLRIGVAIVVLTLTTLLLYNVRSR
jgi:hypothetical protein